MISNKFLLEKYQSVIAWDYFGNITKFESTRDFSYIKTYFGLMKYKY